MSEVDMFARYWSIFTILLCTQAFAETHPELLPNDRYITQTEWRELALGKTVFYFLNGQYYGREYYFPEGNFVRFQTATGICLEGVWEYRPETRAYCFFWGTERPCFHHIWRDGQLYALSTSPNEAGNWNTQTMNHFETGAFECDAGFTS